MVTDGERIIVRGTRLEESAHGVTTERDYEKKIEKPREVDHTRLKSFLTTDGILIIEAPLPPKSLNLRKASNHANSSPQRSSHGGSSTSLRSSSPATVAVLTGTGGPSTAAVPSTINGGALSAPSSASGLRFGLELFQTFTLVLETQTETLASGLRDQGQHLKELEMPRLETKILVNWSGCSRDRRPSYRDHRTGQS